MDYTRFQDTALRLIERFGNEATLHKPVGEPVYDELAGDVVQAYREVSGRAVVTEYTAESIGKTDSMIEAGDVRISAVLDEPPTEVKDDVSVGDDRYNVITATSVKPDGQSVIVYVIQGRRV